MKEEERKMGCGGMDAPGAGALDYRGGGGDVTTFGGDWRGR